MKEKLAFLAVAAAACAGPQVKESPKPEIAEIQCRAFADLLKAVSTKEEGLQPDGSYVRCVSPEDIKLENPHMVRRGAQLEAGMWAVEKVCRDVAQAKGCHIGEIRIGKNMNKVRPFEALIHCPDPAQNSLCSVATTTTAESHCVTEEGKDIFCARVKADPDSVLENPLQPEK